MSDEKIIEIKTGIYKHYKGGQYKVFGIGSNTETKEECVLYQSLGLEKKIWLRPIKNFFEKIEQDGKKINRFEFISTEESFEQKYLRALADYQNLLKRTALEKEEFAKYANEQIILDILPVYDNLKISIQHANEEVDKNGWLEGIKYVIKQFKDILKNLGVEEIETEGKKFNSNEMEALEGQGEMVKKEVRSGYKLKGKVIAPARVILE